MTFHFTDTDKDGLLQAVQQAARHLQGPRLPWELRASAGLQQLDLEPPGEGRWICSRGAGRMMALLCISHHTMMASKHYTALHRASKQRCLTFVSLLLYL
eukprot:scaffold357737_cov17-Prasinocladus_malaysianus.AAC.1